MVLATSISCYCLVFVTISALGISNQHSIRLEQRAAWRPADIESQHWQLIDHLVAGRAAAALIIRPLAQKSDVEL